MAKKWMVIILVIGLALFAVGYSVPFAGDNARRPAIITGANRVVELQRTDSGWEGTWYWYVGDTYNATNLTGVTALGLLEAFNDVKDLNYAISAMAAADFIMVHLGAGATGIKYHVRTTAPDIIFLHRLGQVTGDSDYTSRAILEWNNIKVTYSTAASLDSLFRSINRRSAWDIAFFMEAAYLSGDNTWADDAAAILANTTDTFYYGTDTWWYALNVAGSLRALVGCGYYATYSANIATLLNNLIALVDGENGVGGYVQDTAYAILALNSVGGAARSYSNDLGRWLARQKDSLGGWIEPDGNEYPEVDGEAVRALAATIGSNITIDGFEPGVGKTSSWRRSTNSQGTSPFLGD